MNENKSQSMGTEKGITALELVAKLREENPTYLFGIDNKGEAIAIAAAGRWNVVAAKILGGGWANVASNLMINGKPAWSQESFNAVS